MRRITKAAVVGTMAAGLLGGGASAALADGYGYGYKISEEESTTNLAQCVVNQEVALPGPVTIPGELLGEGGLAYNCTGNEAVVVND